MTDKRLAKAIQRFKNGDETSFKILYEATKTRAYYTILTIVKNDRDAEDLLQDTYMRVIKSIQSYQENTHFAAWVSTIARNCAINHYHQRKNTSVLDVSDNEALFGGIDPDYYKKTYVYQLIKKLDLEDQEIVLRHVLLKETHQTIATALNKPLGTITWRYQQALKKLKKVKNDETD